MKILFHKKFLKHYKKLRVNEQRVFKERLRLFEEDPYDPVLNTHALQGGYKGYQSMNVTGQLRAVFEFVGRDKDTVFFIDIDSHNNLYL